MTINVTQADIDAGGNSCYDCAISKALSRLVKPDITVMTGVAHACFSDAENSTLMLLPDNAQNFIANFGRSQFISDFFAIEITASEPFSFELDVPDWALRVTP